MSLLLRLSVAAAIVPHLAAAQVSPPRHLAKGTWQVVARIGLGNNLLEHPGPIAVDSNRVLVFDYGPMALKSIRLDGRLEWTAGAEGEGPGEFRQASSLALDAQGRAIIADAEQQRVTIFDRRGKLARTIPLGSRYQVALPASRAGSLLLIEPGSDTVAMRADSGAPMQPAAMIPPEMKGAAPITRELAAAASGPGGHVLAFRWSSRMVALDREGRITRACMGIDSLPLAPVLRYKADVEGQPFLVSKVDKGTRKPVQAIAHLGAAVGVLSADTMLDVYAPDCGRYIETRVLPVAASSVVGNGDVLVAKVLEPVPHLVVLRWKVSP